MNGALWFVLLLIRVDHFMFIVVSYHIMFLYPTHYSYTLNQIINKTNQNILFSLRFVILSVLFMILHTIYTIFGGQRLVK